MIGIGTPNSQSSAPFPSPIVASMVVIEIRAAAVPSERAPQRGSREKSIGGYRFGFCRGGLPVVAEASSGTQVMALRSYLKPFAAFSASLVEFITR